MSGAIPSELGDLPSLVGLWLWGNDLSGEIPGELGNLPSLTGTLALAATDLSGVRSLPDLGNLSSLQIAWA